MIARMATIKKSIERSEAYLAELIGQPPSRNPKHDRMRQYLVELEERILGQLKEVYYENIGRRQ